VHYFGHEDFAAVFALIAQINMKYAENTQQYDVCIVVGDGLSARAIEANAISFITMLNEQGELKPGRSPMSITSMGALKISATSSPRATRLPVALNAYSGCLDAKRNCISNVRSAGLSIPVAVQRLMALMKKSKQLGFSGVNDYLFFNKSLCIFHCLK
jgi:ethanolamine ammonia-lyase small subunit